jgi:hypothetical protein
LPVLMSTGRSLGARIHIAMPVLLAYRDLIYK